MTHMIAKAKAEEAAAKAQENKNEPVMLLAQAVALMAESLANHISHIKTQLGALDTPGREG